MMAALLKEIDLRKDYLEGEEIETIYIGGGTPSLLQIADLRLLIEKIRSLFTVTEEAEITIEVNPDDITETLLPGWKEIGINRLSIGVQSFFDEDLKWMNRAHNAQQALESLKLAIKYFNNITIDLIYGTPLLDNDKWRKNLQTAIELNIPHLSCYALTVEAKTPLDKMIALKKSENVDPERQSEQFLILIETLAMHGYEHYEISNCARPGFRSRHNSSYWQGKKYLGIGPSAHSYDLQSRQWNISNNNIYIDSINRGSISSEQEILSSSQKQNEYIMTSLRTIEGLDLNKLEEPASKYILAFSKKYINSGLMKEVDGKLVLTNEGKLLADGIAAALFV